MTADRLLAAFERMAREGWAYEWGAAREGCVDCSGAFVWAFQQAGQSIAHGSNTIARKQIAGSLRPAREAKPGWALFKHAFDGGEPAQYRADGLGNFYHIALCSRDGTRALNAKGAKYGFCSDKLDGYAYAAPLKGVEYEERGSDGDLETVYRAMVTTESDPLRVRASARTGQVIGKIPRGETVDVLRDSGDGWPFVRYNELDGYASAEYLTRIVETETVPGDVAENATSASPPECPVPTVTIIDDEGNTFMPSGNWRVLLNAVD